MLLNVASSYAVLIGTSTHSKGSGLQDLPAVHNNLADMVEVLTDLRVLGLPHDHITLVENPRNAAAVTRVIREIGTRPGISTFIVYYSGHGMPDDLSQLHLALSEASIEEVPASWLPFEWLRRRIRESVATTRVLILDCCYAGLAGPTRMSGSDPIGSQTNIAGTWTLYSSGETFPSWAPLGQRNTMFTRELIDVMRVGVQNGPADLDGDAIAGELRRRMQAIGAPLPEQHNSEMGHRVALAHNLAFADGAARNPPDSIRADAERAALMVSIRVQWADQQVRQVDKLRDDEQYWVIYVLNSSPYPLQNMVVTVTSPTDKFSVDWGGVEPGDREWYILRPPDSNFPPEGHVPEASAFFEVLGIKWRFRDGKVRSTRSGRTAK
jgi:hypothetical protein